MDIISYIQYHNNFKDVIDKIIMISLRAGERHTETISSETKIISLVDQTVKWCYAGIELNLLINYFKYIILINLPINKHQLL